MAAAKGERSRDTAPFIAAMQRTAVDPAPVVDALKRLQASSLGVSPTVQKAVASTLEAIQNRVDANGKMGADLLDAIRQNVGGFLAHHAPNGSVATKEEAAFVPIKAQIVRTLDTAIPGYRNYLATYAERSGPINTMDAMRRILAPVDQSGSNSAGDGVLTLQRLNTGVNREAKRRYGIQPNVLDDLNAIRADLQRASISNSLRAPGSDTAANLKTDGYLAGKIFGSNMQAPKGRILPAAIGGGVGHLIAGPIGGEVGFAAGLTINDAAQAINNRIVKRVGEGAIDSQKAAEMIRQFLAQNKRQAPALLKKYPQWAALIGTSQQQQIPAPR
jgi:hypothetical protein